MGKIIVARMMIAMKHIVGYLNYIIYFFDVSLLILVTLCFRYFWRLWRLETKCCH